ncbi:MAG: hemolysin III family protein [Anaerolineae bacterium]|nr:hemolysin III family protein [Anaerolineae bacterium]
MREPVSGLIHFFAGVLAVAGLAVLLAVGEHDASQQISLVVYGASLALLFFASAAYHLIQARPSTIEVLRKLDHSAIYLLIAGTYTPFCYDKPVGTWHWGILGGIWLLAAVGIGVKVFVIKAPRWVTAGVYLAMGWVSVLMPRDVLHALSPAAFGWLAAGGVLYTLGAAVYITKKLDFFPGVFGFHEVWHVFVVLAGACHYVSVLTYVSQ